MTLLNRLPPIGSSSDKRITDPRLKLLLETGKTPTRLLGEVQRYLLTSGGKGNRRTDMLHPSEIAHSNWCRRAAYYQLTGVVPARPPLHWQTQMVFDEGKEIHRKWQNRIWAIGRLTGEFYCLKCHSTMWDIAPDSCIECGADRAFLSYDEVPLLNKELGLVGHADGIDNGDEAVIEIKSIGVGTLWFEAPDLLGEHTYKLNVNGREREFIDYDELWDSIRRPFPAHIRQAHLYSYMGAPKDEIFLYECKWNQRTKEFVVKYDEDRIADRLDDCRLIQRALGAGKPPSCRKDGCPECRLYEETLNAQPKRIIRRPTADRPTPSTPNGRRIQRTIRIVR